MAFVRSRVNGLKIAIPNDARGIVHRFAIAGGGNELVFDGMSRKDHSASVQADTKPVEMGAGNAAQEPTQQPLPQGLTLNLADDDDKPGAESEPSRPEPKSRRASPDAESGADDDVI